MRKDVPISEEKRVAMCRWLWAMDRDHSSRPREIPQKVPLDPQSRPPAGHLVAPYDKKTEVGDVRLFSPALTPDVDRPVYFAVLGQWDRETFLISPFSPYDEAATDTELVVSRSSHCRVLSLWNSRTIAKTLVGESWLIDQLGARALKDSWRVFRHALTGSGLSAGLARNVGLPVYRPDDPRVVYQLEEAERLEFLVAASEKILRQRESR